MKIGIDISQVAYEGTGVANYTKELVRNLIEVDYENQYVLFGLSFRKKDILLDFANEVTQGKRNVQVKLFPYPVKFADTLWNKYHIVNIEKLTGQLDIFHSSDWIQPPTHAKNITTVHDLVIYKHPELSHPIIVETQKKRLNWVTRECKRIITDSFCSRDDIINILKFGSENIDVVYPGISSEYRPSSEQEKIGFKQKYGLKGEYILAVGTIEPRKNLRNVIAAFEKFKKHSLISSRKKIIELVIAGNSGWENNLKETKDIRMLGFVPNKDMRPLYSSATIFVFPSFYEGFGFPVIEAAACGCPVITSNRGSMKEIVQNAGLLVEPTSTDDLAHKMLQFIVDDKLRGQYVARGFENAKKFSWRKTAIEVLKIYNKLC
jgi:glycosyltransferase involved in cell wall biosynthesis